MEIKRGTYKDQVEEFIYKEILKGNLKPKEQIKESRLSEILHISRAPIREALKELISMGLLEYKPRIGTFVVDVKPDDIYETYVARGVLEGYAAACSYGGLSSVDIEKLRRMCDKMEELAESSKNIKLIDLGDKFHKKIFERCNNKQIVKLTNMLSFKSHLLFSKYWPKLYTPRQIKERHIVMVEALKSKDEGLIEKTVRNHYTETGKKISDLKKKEFENEKNGHSL